MCSFPSVHGASFGLLGGRNQLWLQFFEKADTSQGAEGLKTSGTGIPVVPTHGETPARPLVNNSVTQTGSPPFSHKVNVELRPQVLDTFTKHMASAQHQTGTLFIDSVLCFWPWTYRLTAAHTVGLPRPTHTGFVDEKGWKYVLHWQTLFLKFWVLF